MARRAEPTDYFGGHERSVWQGDALRWLPTVSGAGAIATSPPDSSELSIPNHEYGSWLAEVLSLIFKSSTGPTVIVVTDRKRGGTWQSKPVLVARAASYLGLDLLWHRIALRRALGVTDLYVPTYSHVLAYGPGRPGRPRPDVIEQGPTLWPHGMGLTLADYIARWMAELGVTTLVDPFCGTGTLLAAANRHGMWGMGCEINAERAAVARQLPMEGTDGASY